MTLTPIRDSIATRLLTVVFSIYFLVTLTVTLAHMVAEYQNSQKLVLQELEALHQTFAPGLSTALWSTDEDQVRAMVQGMITNPSLVGVKIESTFIHPISAGITLDQNQHLIQTEAASSSKGMFFKFFPMRLLAQSYPLTHKNYQGEIRKLGTLTFYSSNQVILHRVQYGFLFILVNSVVKTLALWVIFLWVSRFLLNRPLSSLVQATRHIEFDNLESFHVEVKTSGRNELKLLEEAFNLMIQKLLFSRMELQKLNLNLEEQVRQRTGDLEESLKQLEQQNTVLVASNRKLEDINSTKESLLKRLKALYETHVKAIRSLLDRLLGGNCENPEVLLTQAAREAYHIEETLRPVQSLYFSEQAIRSKRVLLAENNKKQQIIAKMALGGSGVELDVVSDLETGRKLLSERHYDILCLDADFMELKEFANQKKIQVQSVFMTSADIPEYLNTLRQNPELSNIVSRNEDDRSFTLKNILTTISKLITQDLFGLEKYLGWGVDVRQFPIIESHTRHELVNQMESDLESFGIRRSLIQSAVMVAEELLMNAIYDAPTDAQGKSLYNHLPRTVPVRLQPHEQGVFRYACDGFLLAISVEDPFGAFYRQIILDYLTRCYQGQTETTDSTKGGAGRGLFQIMNTTDLFVINVKPRLKTEVIALFNLDPNKTKSQKTTSFHYFCG